MSEWIPLSELVRGAVFETKDGCRAVKSEYHYPNGGCECILLASGEYAHFAQHIDNPALEGRAHNATLVRVLAVVSPLRPVDSDSADAAALRQQIAAAEREAVALIELPDGGEAFNVADNEIIRMRSDLYNDKSEEPAP